MGYSVTLCDVCKLHFADESFDFVLCWDGRIEAAKELILATIPMVKRNVVKELK